MTPSSSCGSSVSMIAVVQQTTAFFCERPMANAFGTSESATAIRGLGRADDLRAHRRKRQLVRQEQLAERERGQEHDHDRDAAAGGEDDAREDDIERAEQEERQEHPGLKTPISREDGARSGHAPKD